MSFFADLSERRRHPELMDDPGLEPHRHRRALRALGRVNLVSRTAPRIWSEILGVGAGEPPLRVLDVASGGGDVAILLERLARRRGVDLRVDGCDASSVAVQHAVDQAARAGSKARFFELDVLEATLPEGYDVVYSSLFLHHLDHREAVGLLRAMAEAAERLVLVQDLVRSRVGYLLAYVGVRLLSRSKVARTDGPLSVLSAFTLDEVWSLAEQAGLAGARLGPCWPQRFSLVWTP